MYTKMYATIDSRVDSTIYDATELWVANKLLILVNKC